MKKNITFKEDSAELSGRIKLLRGNLNLSIQEMADLVGYSKTHYFQIEEGILVPSDMFLERLCKETGVNRKWLDSGKEPKGLLRPAINHREIAKRILNLRMEMELTQVEFAKRTDISQSAVSRIEKFASGDREEILITRRQIEGICKGCNVGYDWIMFGYDAAKKYPCNEEMVSFLNRHPKLRAEIKRRMDEEFDINPD